MELQYDKILACHIVSYGPIEDIVVARTKT